MKKERRKVGMTLVSIEADNKHCQTYDGWRTIYNTEYTYTFVSSMPIDTETLEFTVEEDVPETLTEFREKKNLTKDELVEWLNKNYK